MRAKGFIQERNFMKSTVANMRQLTGKPSQMLRLLKLILRKFSGMPIVTLILPARMLLQNSFLTIQ